MFDTSLSNLQKIKEAERSKLDLLRDEEAKHPNKNSDIYATIAIKEIKEGLTPEDFKNMNKAKAR